MVTGHLSISAPDPYLCGSDPDSTLLKNVQEKKKIEILTPIKIGTNR